MLINLNLDVQSHDFDSDLDKACSALQPIKIGAHSYFITQNVAYYDAPNKHSLKLVQEPVGGCSNETGLKRAQADTEKSIRRLHQARIENYKSQDKKSAIFNIFDEPWFERQVMNLGAGYPASAVADALEKAAEFVRNQAVTWEDKK